MPTTTVNLSIPILTIVVTAALFSAANPARQGTRKGNCIPAIETIGHSRNLPHAYYDQAMNSLPELYPQHELTASRRLSRLGTVTYSLVVYKKKPSAHLVQIEGAAERYPNAWRFRAACPEDSLVEGLITTLEMISTLEL